MDTGHLKYLISQNIDGLHRKSGIPIENIAELHGNTNLEICQKCGKDYLRDYRTRNKKVFDDHLTGRKCDNRECSGDLFDTIVNFGEGINKPLLKRAAQESEKSDLCIALGSSLLVKPAMLLP
jgi:NAD-dependent SIR2 family protein deacetylase